METDKILLNELVHDARRSLEKEREEINERAEKINAFMKMADHVDEVLTENDGLREEIDSLRSQLAEEKALRSELETKFSEMGKLSAGVAKKASQDDLLRAMRSYLNISKRKSPSKREAAKMVFTELFTTAKLDLPEDILELLSHLDDEQLEAKVVNVGGSYNEIHDNREVSLKD